MLLLNKPYLNGVTLREQILFLKCYQSLEQKRRGLDLFKEVLWVSVGQSSAKLQAVKGEGMKKIPPPGWLEYKVRQLAFEKQR